MSIKILLNYLTHGDETLGLKVAEQIQATYPSLINKSLFFSLANPAAFAQGKRYIDTDLNRSFPGKPDGSHEERRAFELTQTLLQYDLVIDIHSTKSETRDTVIITKQSSLTKETIEIIAPKYVLEMQVDSNSALISYARAGIALEFGNNASEEVYNKNILAISCVVEFFINKRKIPNLGYNTEYFQVTRRVPKPKHYQLYPNISNFTLVRKGEPYAFAQNMPDLVAEDDFYPVIFGQSNYDSIFGFAARKAL